MIRFFLCVFLMQSIFACTSTQNLATDPADRLFDDSVFAKRDSLIIESPEDIFHLSDAAKRFVDNSTGFNDSSEKKVRALVTAIFNQAQLNLRYDNTATNIASETFEKGLANCISMTIMAHSMFEYAGVDADFMLVDVPEYWTRQEGYSLINGHVNLRLNVSLKNHLLQLGSRSINVDFDPQDYRQHFDRDVISRSHIVAIFYNNKAANAIIENRLDDAYQYLKAAQTQFADMPSVLTNLGILYRMRGEYEHAEDTYRYVMQRNPDNLTAIENLAVLYQHMGKTVYASRLQRQVYKARRYNPFYHFILGEEATGRGQYEQALAHYRKGLSLQRRNATLVYSIGKSLYQLERFEEAGQHMARAAQLAKDEYDKQRYSAKLAALQEFAKQRQVL